MRPQDPQVVAQFHQAPSVPLKTIGPRVGPCAEGWTLGRGPHHQVFLTAKVVGWLLKLSVANMTPSTGLAE